MEDTSRFIFVQLMKLGGELSFLESPVMIVVPTLSTLGAYNMHGITQGSWDLFWIYLRDVP